MRSLGSITSLTELDLSRTFCEEGLILDDLLCHLSALTALCKLKIASTAVHYDGLKAIGHLKVSLAALIDCQKKGKVRG